MCFVAELFSKDISILINLYLSNVEIVCGVILNDLSLAWLLLGGRMGSRKLLTL